MDKSIQPQFDLSLDEAISITQLVTDACMYRVGVTEQVAHLPSGYSLIEMLVAREIVLNKNRMTVGPKMLHVVSDPRLIAATYAIEKYGGLRSLTAAMGPATRQGNS